MKTNWITKTGEKISIHKMTDNHLMNTIKYLERKSEEYRKTLKFPCFSGELAQELAEREYDSIMEMNTAELTDWSTDYGIYRNLLKEAKKRSLPTGSQLEDL